MSALNATAARATLIQSNLRKRLKQMLGIFSDDPLAVCGEQQHKRNHTG
jgi:hypothetical protein